MKVLAIPMSGRRGEFVFYMRGRRLFRRRYVVPRNVRTAARRRMRRSFGAVAKAWSKRLTEEQRRAWMASGAKVKSHPRLSQWGWLSGEMHFQAINSSRLRIGAAMLVWPPERVVFGPSPVEGLALSYVNGRIRLRLRVSGPVTEDIMVFGQAPCSPGRKKWRRGAYLGLLPAVRDGECDITDMYVERYGEPEPGKKVFIRTRQQRNGWEGRNQDCSGVVLAEPVADARPETGQIRNPKAEPRRKSENRNPIPDGPRILYASRPIAVSCAMHKGVVPKHYRSSSQVTPMQCHRGTGCSHGWAAAVPRTAGRTPSGRPLPRSVARRLGAGV